MYYWSNQGKASGVKCKRRSLPLSVSVIYAAQYLQHPDMPICPLICVGLLTGTSYSLMNPPQINLLGQSKRRAIPKNSIML